MERRILASLFACALVIGLSATAQAELASWDQAKVTALAKQLEDGSKALYDTFYKQPPPNIGSGHSQDYRRLKQEVRRIKSEARELAAALEKGEGRARVAMFLDHSESWRGLDVPDPYYGGSRGFEEVLDMVEEASARLLEELLAGLER